MATNLHAAFRYKVIDRCIKDRAKSYFWEDLAEAVSEDFTQFFGVGKKPSKRTIMGDIAVMRSGKLGYYAPINFDNELGYHYSEGKFSIHNVPLNKSHLTELVKAVHIVKQLTNNEKLTSIKNSLLAIEQSLNLEVNPHAQPTIYFEHSLNEPGQKWLDAMYQYITDCHALLIEYAPFDSQAIHVIVSPLIIKEYNNRWYIIAIKHLDDSFIHLSLDRIISCKKSLQSYRFKPDFDHDTYFRDVFGITIFDDSKPCEIIFNVSSTLSKYIISKPIHTSQEKIDISDLSATFSLYVIINYEIKHKLISFGADLEVLSPPHLRAELSSIIANMYNNYNI
ncbi:MAG: WYL domain-containing protein [Saprospiraceae bacterium]